VAVSIVEPSRARPAIVLRCDKRIQTAVPIEVAELDVTVISSTKTLTTITEMSMAIV
jgi:hypothetical protein